MQVRLENKNDKIQKEFKVEKENQFKEFIREMKLYKKSSNMHARNNKLIQYLLNKMAKAKKDAMTLEKIIFQIFTQPKKCQQMFKKNILSSIYNQNFKFFGFYHEMKYEITIFPLYEDQPKVIVLVGQELTMESEVRYDQEIVQQNRIISKLNDHNLNQFREALIYLKYLKLKLEQQMENRHQLSQLKPCLNSTMSRFYQLFNSQINVQCFRSKRLYFKCHMINMMDLMEEIIYLIKPKLCKKKQILQIKNKQLIQQTNIVQDRRAVQQILLSLLYNSIEQSPIESIIELKMDLKYDFSIDQHLIDISILDQGPYLSQRFIDKLPSFNPNLFQLIKQNQAQKLKLGLLISNYLISRIGPFNNYKILQFQIYQNLTQFLTDEKLKNNRFKFKKIKIENFASKENDF